MVAERRGAALQQIAAAQQKDGVFGWPEGVPEAGACAELSMLTAICCGRAFVQQKDGVFGWPEGMPEAGACAEVLGGLAGCVRWGVS